MITTRKIEAFRKDLNEALKAVAEKHGLDTKAEYNISYSANDFTVKSVKFIEKVEGKSAEQVMFEKVCKSFGFNPEDYGRMYPVSGREFKLVGFKANAPKSPYIVQDTAGKQYKVREHAIPQSFDPYAGIANNVQLEMMAPPTSLTGVPDGKGGMWVTPHWDNEE